MKGIILAEGTGSRIYLLIKITNKRMVKITERKNKQDWANFLEENTNQYEGAEKIILVMDNLNTHVPGSFYELFQPDKAKAIGDRFELFES